MVDSRRTTFALVLFGLMTSLLVSPSAMADDASKVDALIDALTTELKFGHHDTFSTDSSHARHMVREYIEANYDDLASEFRFVDWANSISVDEMIAGTITYRTALGAAQDGAAWLNETIYESESASFKKAVERRFVGYIRSLKDQPGIYFGFDGFAQNGCAAPTLSLLVLDTARKTVFVIDLNACTES